MTTTSGGGTLSLIHGTALSIPLADRSVHLVVTSPPYFALRDYRTDDGSLDGQKGSEPTPHHFLAALWAVMDECWRVLRDDGSCWVNLGDKFAGSGGSKPQTFRPLGLSRDGPDRYNQNTGGLRSKCRMLLPHRFALGLIDPEYRAFEEHRAGLTPTADPPQWICRMDGVWSKLNGLPESVTDRVRASHEYWLHFTKSERYFAAMDEIREGNDERYAQRRFTPAPLKTLGNPDRNWGSPGVLRGDKEVTGNPLGKLPGSVWSVATEPLSIPEFMVARYPGELEPTWMDEKAAWRWMRSTGHDSSPWPQTPEDGRQLRAAPAHFAAFPSEFPRRIVSGWSPSGVCVACGEPRRPICERTGRVVSSRGDALLGGDHQNVYDESRKDNGRQIRAAAGPSFPKHETVVSGYACACPTSDAPTRPAVCLDPFSGTGTAPIVAAALGRHGIGVDLSWDYHRIARWRDRDGGLRAKALGVDRPERQVPGQLSLLDGAL